MSNVTPKTVYPLLVAITLFSFGIRVWGITFGLPFAYHPDEQQYVSPAIEVVSGDFEPLAYYNPALYVYVLGAVYGLTYLGLTLFGAFPVHFDLSAAWGAPMLPWISGLLFLARYTTAASSVLTTLLVYQLGRYAYSRETGLGAAIIYGLTFLPAREAHFAVSDTPVALGVAVTLYVCLKIVRRGRWSDYVWAGLALGLAAATKYTAALLVLPLGTAHLLSRRYQTWPQRLGEAWRVIGAGLVAVAGFLLASPYTVLAYDEFWADFSENLNSARIGFQGLDLDPAGGAIFYLKALIWGMGWPVLILFLAAIGLALWRRRRVDIVLLVLPVIGMFYMQRQAMYFVRWLTPFLPALAVLGAETAHVATRRVSGWLPRQAIRQPFASVVSRVSLLPIILVTALTLPSTYVALSADYVFSQPDTRTEALNWIRDNIPPSSIVAAEVLSPPWGPPLALPGLNIGPYQFAPVPEGGVLEVELDQYRAWGVRYIVASSFYYARPLLDKTRQARLAARLQTLDNEAELIALFEPYPRAYDGFFYHDQVYGPANNTLDVTRPGPTIRIYRLPE